jgi:saccharopine dehydrogenase-like NADP-dependent oxidoreductase
VTDTLRKTGRYALRCPGWSDFWRPMKELGFLSHKPVQGLPGDVAPYQLVDKLLEPQQHYAPDEKDLVAMVNVFEGILGGRKVRQTVRLLMGHDLDTGLMAMAKGVGFPASIAAQMIASSEIVGKGIL